MRQKMNVYMAIFFALLYLRLKNGSFTPPLELVFSPLIIWGILTFFWSFFSKTEWGYKLRMWATISYTRMRVRWLTRNMDPAARAVAWEQATSFEKAAWSVLDSRLRKKKK